MQCLQWGLLVDAEHLLNGAEVLSASDSQVVIARSKYCLKAQAASEAQSHRQSSSPDQLARQASREDADMRRRSF